MAVLFKKMKKNYVAFLSILLMCQTFQNISAHNEKKNLDFAKKSCKDKTDISIMGAVKKYLKEKILVDKKKCAIGAGIVLSIPLLMVIANAAKNKLNRISLAGLPSEIKERFDKEFTKEEQRYLRNQFYIIYRFCNTHLKENFEKIGYSHLVLLRFIFIARSFAESKIEDKDICCFTINTEDPKFYINHDIIRFLSLDWLYVVDHGKNGGHYEFGSNDINFRKTFFTAIFIKIMICQRFNSLKNEIFKKNLDILQSDMIDVANQRFEHWPLKEKDINRILLGSAAMTKTLENPSNIKFHQIIEAAMNSVDVCTFGFHLKSFKLKSFKLGIMNICRLFKEILLEKHKDELTRLKAEIEKEIDEIKKIETSVAVFVKLKNDTLESWNKIKDIKFT